MRQLISALGLLAFLALPFVGCSQQAEHKTETKSSKTMSTSGNPYYSRTDITPVKVSNEEWKKILPNGLYRVAREAATEQAFTGEYWNYDGIGDYYCAVCGNHLFKSDAKFASGCGWPSFFETIRPDAAIYRSDNSYGMERTEVLCGRCESHLGHIFDDGPAPTYKRFCMNSVSLEFVPIKK